MARETVTGSLFPDETPRMTLKHPEMPYLHSMISYHMREMKEIFYLDADPLSLKQPGNSLLQFFAEETIATTLVEEPSTRLLGSANFVHFLLESPNFVTAVKGHYEYLEEQIEDAEEYRHVPLEALRAAGRFMANAYLRKGRKIDENDRKDLLDHCYDITYDYRETMGLAHNPTDEPQTEANRGKLQAVSAFLKKHKRTALAGGAILTLAGIGTMRYTMGEASQSLETPAITTTTPRPEPLPYPLQEQQIVSPFPHLLVPDRVSTGLDLVSNILQRQFREDILARHKYFDHTILSDLPTEQMFANVAQGKALTLYTFPDLNAGLATEKTFRSGEQINPQPILGVATTFDGNGNVKERWVAVDFVEKNGKLEMLWAPIQIAGSYFVTLKSTDGKSLTIQQVINEPLMKKAQEMLKPKRK